MAGTIVVDRIESDSSYTSTINVASKVNFAGGMQIGGQDTTFGGMRNRIINGAMTIDQRNAGASVTPTTSSYLVDRFYIQPSQASKLSFQQNAGAVTPPVGFTNYLGATSLSAYSIGASDYFNLGQNIEGYNVADLGWGTANAQSITLSFWVRSSLTGTFGVSFRNDNADRNYQASYTITSANTWEQKSITIAGDTTGTWTPMTNNAGLRIGFGLGVGSNFTASAGAWGAGNKFGLTGATSVVGTNGATWQITGVQLEKGSSATSFDYRPIQTELDLCYRYCFAWRTDSLGYTNYGRFPVSFNTSTTECNTDIFLPKPMRTTAYSLSWNNKAYHEYFVTGGGATGSSIVLNTDANGMNWINIRFTSMTGTSLTSGGLSGIRLVNVTDGALIVSAEL